MTCSHSLAGTSSRVPHESIPAAVKTPVIRPPTRSASASTAAATVLAPGEPLLLGGRHYLAVDDQRRRQVVKDRIDSENPHRTSYCASCWGARERPGPGSSATVVRNHATVVARPVR